jgi:hypothetical protein
MKEILNRFKVLIIKLVSIKGLIWILATVGLFLGVVDTVSWEVVSLVLAGIRGAEKITNAGEYGRIK